MTSFATQVEHLDGRAIVELRGELDITTVSTLRDALRTLTYRYDAPQVTIDCEALEFIDARGLGELVRVSKAFPSGRIRLHNPSRSFCVLLDVTATSDVFEVDPLVGAESIA
ncbi:MAG TPA: STAS domain-containing protein [Acidimicrobiales bacterium]|nr:STAS domain-containing protein [Acidimicrobiales bacterium]